MFARIEVPDIGRVDLFNTHMNCFGASGSPREKVTEIQQKQLAVAEKFILENATETLKKTRVVYAEYYEANTQNFGYRRAEIKNILEKNGFTCELSDLSKHVIDVDNIIGVKTI